MNLEYLLGVLNSKVIGFIIPKISTPFRGGYWALNRQYISQLPIPIVDFSNPINKARHDRMVSLVAQMLTLHKQVAEAKTPHDKNFLQRQIEQTDRKIDQLVYELYGLTEEEIRIVEAS